MKEETVFMLSQRVYYNFLLNMDVTIKNVNNIWSTEISLSIFQQYSEPKQIF